MPGAGAAAGGGVVAVENTGPVDMAKKEDPEEEEDAEGEDNFITMKSSLSNK